MKKLIYTIFCSLLIVGCTKKPTACFTYDKQVVDKGESVVFTDCSENAYYWEWQAYGTYNSTWHTGKEVEIFFDEPGQATVNLTTYDSKKKKRASTYQTITVNETYGDVTFWTNNAQYTQISVIVNPIGIGYVTDVNAIEPNCDQSGCANFHLTTGTYGYTATATTTTSSYVTFSGSVTVGKDECIKILLN